MAGPDEPESKSNVGCIAVGLVAVIALLVVCFFVLDAVIGRQ